MTTCGVEGVNRPFTAMKAAARVAVQARTARKPKALRIGPTNSFMPMAPAAAAKVVIPDSNGV